MFDKKTFAERIKQLRVDRGWTMRDASLKLGAAEGSVRGWEHAKFLPSLELLVDIVKLYGVSFEWILFGQDKVGGRANDP